MCIFFESKMRRKRATGWKVVAVHDGAIYSMHTGMKYEVGKITPPKEYDYDRATSSSSYRVLDEGSTNYIHDYVGFTSVFVSKKSAVKYAAKELCSFEVDDCALVKMTLGGELYKSSARLGLGHDLPVYSGDTILTICDLIPAGQLLRK